MNLDFIWGAKETPHHFIIIFIWLIYINIPLKLYWLYYIWKLNTSILYCSSIQRLSIILAANAVVINRFDAKIWGKNIQKNIPLPDIKTRWNGSSDWWSIFQGSRELCTYLLLSVPTLMMSTMLTMNELEEWNRDWRPTSKSSFYKYCLCIYDMQTYVCI